MVEEQYYRRLLRWYPRSWRAYHGEALLGIMLDEAEALGRSRPTVGQRWSAFLHGTGNRLGARAALWCAAIGLLLGLVSLALLFIAIPAESEGKDTIFSWIDQAMRTLPGAVIAAGYLGLARERGMLPAPHAFIATVMAALTCVVATVSNFAWVIASEAAEANATAPLLGRLSMPLLVTYSVMGALTVAVAVDGALSIRTRLHPVPRAALATMAGIPAIAVTPVVAMIPISILGASIVLLILYRTLRQPQGGQQPPTASPALPVPPPSLHAGIPEYPGPLAPPEESRTPGSLPASYPQDALDDEALPMSHRVGARLGRKTALWCGVLAVITYFCSMAVILVADYLPGRRQDSPFFIQTSLSCLVGFFLIVGTVGLLRERSAVTPKHAAYATLFSMLVPIAGAALTVLSMVDAITASSGAQSHWSDRTAGLILFVAYLLGTAAAGALIAGLSVCRRMEPGLRTVVGLIIGSVVSPPLWFLLMFLGTMVNLPWAIGLIVIGAISRPAPASYPAVPSAIPRSDPRSASTLSGRRILWIRILAVIAIVIGIGAIAWGVPDGGAGAAGAHLAFIPLLAALALWVSGKFPASAVSTWGPTILAWASMVGFMIRTWPPLREALPVAGISVLCSGAALAWAVFTWFPARRILRVLAGAGAGLTYMITMVPTLAFLYDYFLFAFVPILTPVYGLIILRRPPTPAPPAPGMSPDPAVPWVR